MRIYNVILAVVMCGLCAVARAEQGGRQPLGESCVTAAEASHAYIDSTSQWLHEKWRTNTMMIGVGHTDILDTYLSPEKYRGFGLRLLSHTRRERQNSAWMSQLQHEGSFAYADSRSGNGGTMAGGYTFRYSLLHRWNVSVGRYSFRLMAGGTVAANGGFVYNTRNGNNPANARLSVQAEPTVAVDIPIGRPSHSRGISLSPGDCAHFPVILRYEVSAPLAGLMFSPNYGQSYYEIFTRGNYDHNCVPTTFGSTPSLRQMLTVDFRLAHVKWRIGYLGTIEQSHVNNLKTHAYTHSVVIGIVKRFRTVRM